MEAFSSQLNLEIYFKNKTLTEEDFNSRFGEDGMYKEAQCFDLSLSFFHPEWLKHLPKTLKSLKLYKIDQSQFRKFCFVDRSSMLVEITKASGEISLKLKFLDISGNGLGDAEAAEITKLTFLRSLDTSCNGLTSVGAQHLARLSELSSLKITENRLKDAGAAEIAKLTSLRSLDILHNYLTADGAQHLAKLRTLNYLDISSNKLRDA